MGKYKHLLFDADGTLFDFKKSEKDCFLQVSSKFIPGVEPERTYERYHKINDDLWKALERGEITRERLQVQRFETLLSELSLDISQGAQMNKTYMSLLAQSVYLIDGAKQICEELSKRYTLWIITNGTASNQHGRFDKSGIKQYFKGIFISEEIGYQKPRPEFFDAVKAHIGADESEMLIIGDSLSADIAGGKAAGIDTCYFSPKAIGEYDSDYVITSLLSIYDIL
ncbi:MAG: noncanonical pyrimidine nucleotidase, YjjG family [Ruminococcaceae bacterium]|nr:noncanonical pyrimidine nucleotidase, YjjG family [Oscillospiraceae bacterium]